LEIKDIDLQKSEQMFKEREIYEKLYKEYEQKQQTFIDEILEKYNVQTKEDLLKVIHLFPEGASKFFVLNRFNKKKRIQNSTE